MRLYKTRNRGLKERVLQYLSKDFERGGKKL